MTHACQTLVDGKKQSNNNDSDNYFKLKNGKFKFFFN